MLLPLAIPETLELVRGVVPLVFDLVGDFPVGLDAVDARRRLGHLRPRHTAVFTATLLRAAALRKHGGRRNVVAVKHLQRLFRGLEEVIPALASRPASEPPRGPCLMVSYSASRGRPGAAKPSLSNEAQ